MAANGGLNLREEPTASSTKLLTVPNGTILRITEIEKEGTYFWGKTTYEDKIGWVRLDYTVYQKATVSSIEITSLPEKINYTVGDSFSIEGMIVEAKFTDGTAFEIAGYTVSGYNMEQAGTYTVQVIYGEFSDSFTITVKEKVIPPTEKPASSAFFIKFKSTSLCTSGSRTTPFLPTLSFPASN